MGFRFIKVTLLYCDKGILSVEIISNGLLAVILMIFYIIMVLKVAVNYIVSLDIFMTLKLI